MGDARPIDRQVALSWLTASHEQALGLPREVSPNYRQVPSPAGNGWSIALLIASTLLGGGAGDVIRMVFERRYGAGP